MKTTMMTIKRYILSTVLCAIAPLAADAQVEKQVEVTKEYIPSIEQAAKLSATPDMTDTTQMRPEIGYSVTPVSLNTPLEMRPIRPTEVTYWHFNRPLPCYLKLGAGYPLRSAADFQAATQHPNTGYFLGFLHHEGRYADIRNDFGCKNQSARMLNRVGGAAGLHLGRHLLEGAVSYENRLYHRYGAYEASTAADLLPAAPGARIDYGDADVKIRIGDDFQDLSRLNFDVSIAHSLFYDQTSWVDNGNRPRQASFHAGGKIARAFGRRRFLLAVDYDRFSGRRSIDGFKEHRIHAGARYGTERGAMKLEMGVDYYHDRISGTENQNYLLPFVRLDFDLGIRKLRPFLEVDGSVHDNSYRSLTRQCPYVTPATCLEKSSVDYNGRLGIRGDLWRNRFSYRVYAAFSIHDYHNYWYATGLYDPGEQRILAAACSLEPLQARQTVASFHGEAEFQPISSLRMKLGAHGYLYNDDPDFGNGAPSFEADFSIRYAVKRISIEAALSGQTARKWTLLCTDTLGTEGKSAFKAPATMNLRVAFDWKITGRLGLFAEGDNLLNQRLYRYPWYPEYGANFTAGIKFAF